MVEVLPPVTTCCSAASTTSSQPNKLLTCSALGSMFRTVQFWLSDEPATFHAVACPFCQDLALVTQTSPKPALPQALAGKLWGLRKRYQGPEDEKKDIEAVQECPQTEEVCAPLRRVLRANCSVRLIDGARDCQGHSSGGAALAVRQQPKRMGQLVNTR